MMRLDIHEITSHRALVSRNAARMIATAVKARTDPVPDGDAVILDFSQVEAVTPSFVDELLYQLSELSFRGYRTVKFLSPPDRLSDKFKAIGRARQIAMDEEPSDGWVLELPKNVG